MSYWNHEVGEIKSWNKLFYIKNFWIFFNIVVSPVDESSCSWGDAECLDDGVAAFPVRRGKVRPPRHRRTPKTGRRTVRGPKIIIIKPL